MTGASSGIGEAFARRLGRDGYDLTLVARRRERLEQIARDIEAASGVCVEVWPADLSDPAETERLAAAVAERPPLGLLVLSAGFGTRALFTEIEPGVISAMNRLQVESPVQLVRAALPSMIEAHHGRIIVLSSLAGLFTTARYTTYGATKAYLNHFVDGLAAELEATGVSVQTLCPGLTRTEFFDSPLLEGFRYEQAPPWVWQSPDEVVDESLASSARLCVPGRLNRVLVALLQAPIAGRIVRGALGLANRGGLY